MCIFGYCKEACSIQEQIYGAENLQPNHHWAVHIPDQVLDYGPVYNIWTFLTECLNKVLKGYNSNNRTGGLLEVSMMREFSRATGLESLVCQLKSIAESDMDRSVKFWRLEPMILKVLQ